MISDVDDLIAAARSFFTICRPDIITHDALLAVVTLLQSSSPRRRRYGVIVLRI